ncbi:epoxide hydrolase domain-containing protein [Dendrothele bispora CBS 962.96]|uniref:Epoxide hydrolase domain-containing protein n=1 Tax=Dendrothele bispora (strain CBS 962.96) TaxID=1314807 RepID=A0A4V4HBM7_DENBC|nr:epoxide hydrolase domain-containing protein [Dendrothele bispora CBS 962.96]
MSTAEPFQINVSDDLLSWINDRVKTARIIPDVTHPPNEEWVDGTPSAVMHDIVAYWKEKYDWRSVEKRLNETFKMFTMDIKEGDEVISLHFVHHRSEREGAVPLLFSHGWPGNFLEVESLLKLTNPEDPNAQAYHIVAPSIPGFTFSSSPSKPGFSIPRVASTYHTLMQNLGYTHFFAQGGDWGSMITRSLSNQFPSSLLGIHLNFLVSLPPSALRHPIKIFSLLTRWFTPEEKQKLARMQWWMKQESGYSRIQGTKPQTVSYGLLDSPIGMLAWIREKLQSLAEPSFTWEPELVITWTMLYLLSNSSWHARIYKEAIPNVAKEVLSQKTPYEVPFGYSSFPLDVGYVPRWWAEGAAAENIVFWKEHSKGGHFASVEVPEELIGDLQEFVKVVKEKGDKGTWEKAVKAGQSGRY